MRHWLLVAVGLVILSWALGGCTEQASSTEFAEDGTVVKVVTIRENMLSSFGAGMGNDEEGTQTLRDKVVFEGEGWTVTESSDEEGQVVTAEKRMSSWEGVDAGWKLKISDSLSVFAKTSANETDGYTNFEEKYWLAGEKNITKQQMGLEELKEKLQSVWMKGELSDADAMRLAEGVNLKTARIVFGPNEPILSLMFTSMKRFEREFRIRAFEEISPLFVGVNDMTFEDAREQTRKLLEVWQAAKAVGEGEPSENTPEGEESQNSFSISVSFKGPVVKEHNGRLDPTTDEVFWDFYSMTLEADPVTCAVRFRKAQINNRVE